MIIGIDFDNTIVSYDRLFHQVCIERNLIPGDIPQNKSDVRNYLRRIGQEDVWTELQGYVYGARMAEADPFPGALEFIRRCRDAGLRVRIISHKTRWPFKGDRYDLHQAAIGWMELHGLFDPNRIGLSRDDLFLELTREAKLERIAACRCDVFIDDLPELLGDPAFPQHVRRLLFDPNELYRELPFQQITRWNDAWQIIIESHPSNTPSTGADLEPRIAPFLHQHGFTSTAALRPITGGGNNRVFRVENDAGPAVLKVYFRSPNDPRDRFGAERSFYDWIIQRGIRRTPEPIGWDTEQQLGLLSFVDGRKLTPSEVGESEIAQAIDFIAELNAAKQAPDARQIPIASEACFSIAEHLACVDRRIARLAQIGVDSDLDRAAADFVQTTLQPVWEKIRSAIISDSVSANDPIESPIPETARCLSPSDFGFHNALLARDGKLRFFDFEYAGWDDLAKLICDFFCQPQVPVPLQFWSSFADKLQSAHLMNESSRRRAERLFPAYRVKWCCILLNEFLPAERARRAFATDPATATERKATQLQRARQWITPAIAPPPRPV